MWKNITLEADKNQRCGTSFSFTHIYNRAGQGWVTMLEIDSVCFHVDYSLKCTYAS
jgi:hypothetical protein